jgi:hypothetical protein
LYANQNSPEIFLYLIAGAARAVVPLVMLALFLWLASKACFFLVCLPSNDGGMSAREQRQRHKLENWAARMALMCFIAGISLIAMGQSGEGAVHIKLPGGIEFENAGTPLVLLGIGNSLIWMLFKLRGSAESDKVTEKAPSGLTENESADHPQALSLLGNMNYWHAGLITAGLLPFLNIFAIPVGALLAWGISKRQG